jgi:hypothetical protein
MEPTNLHRLVESLSQKNDGSERHLGIPNVQERLIQQAIMQVLTPIFDPDFKKDRRKYTRSIHNYFFAKTLDVLRPGGVLAFISNPILRAFSGAVGQG